MDGRRFDEAYYHRFYDSPESQVYSPEEHDHLARFVFSYAAWSRFPIESVLDVGAGVGHWKRWIESNHPTVEYTGTEISAAMAKKHGFLNKDIARWRDRKKHDLVICMGVLQYLPDPDVAPAVANLAAMSKGLIYLEITTRTDLRENCDKDRTDQDIYIRNGSYYRGILTKHLTQIGAGLWWPKDKPASFFELEVPG